MKKVMWKTLISFSANASTALGVNSLPSLTITGLR